MQLVVSDEQASMIVAAATPVPVHDQAGRLIGYVTPATDRKAPSAGPAASQIREAEKRLDSNGPWYTTAQVMEHLRSLETT
jgi:hypothetical protein